MNDFPRITIEAMREVMAKGDSFATVALNANFWQHGRARGWCSCCGDVKTCADWLPPYQVCPSCFNSALPESKRSFYAVSVPDQPPAVMKVAGNAEYDSWTCGVSGTAEAQPISVHKLRDDTADMEAGARESFIEGVRYAEQHHGIGGVGACGEPSSKPCPECGGEGICYRTQALDDCTACKGTGRVAVGVSGTASPRCAGCDIGNGCPEFCRCAAGVSVGADGKRRDERGHVLHGCETCDGEDECTCRASGVKGTREARPLGCALAMGVMQSDLYPKLDDAERADCDELVRQNLEWFKRDAGVSGTAPAQEFYCNKCGYFGPVQVFHERPNGSGKCDYMAVPMKANRRCELPPPGWSCSREPGHEGPCAARPAAGVAVPEGGQQK